MRRVGQDCWSLRTIEGSCRIVTSVDGCNGMAAYGCAGNVPAAFRNLCQLLPRAHTKQQCSSLGIYGSPRRFAPRDDGKLRLGWLMYFVGPVVSPAGWSDTFTRFGRGKARLATKDVV